MAQDRWSRDQHIKLVNIIGDPSEGMLTRSMAAKLTAAPASECLFTDFLFEIEPKKVFKKKKDEVGTIFRNKEKLVAQGFSQEEGIYYDETFAPVANMEAIRIFLAFATYMNFIVFQMGVKSLDKALYRLKQAPMAWDSVKKYEISNSALVKKLMVPPNNLGPDLAGKPVNETLYRGMIGCLMYLTASRPDIEFLTCLCARYQANPKESHLIAVKRIFRKSTLGACQLLRGKLVYWSAKK
ncbi:retrovirus-related pol polyprotein from transposon TNT 1-94 [Tanacetum coccineum]